MPLKKDQNSLGTPQEYFPLDFPVVSLDDTDLISFQQLSVEQRIAWLITMQRLIRQHYQAKRLKPFDRG